MSEKKFRELKIDEELRDLLPPLTEDEYKFLEDSIKEHGCSNPIYTWNDYIVDGHNRYGICKKYNYGFEVIVLDSNYTKDDIIEWMIDTQLGRRNLTPIQRIAIAEKYREVIKKKAREKQLSTLKQNSTDTQKSAERSKANKNETRDKLAKIAGVSHDTYEKGVKILKSDNEEVKQQVKNGEIKINTAYNQLFTRKEKNDKDNKIEEKQIKITTKQCNECGQDKNINEFYTNHDKCKICEQNESVQSENNKINNEDFQKLLERKYTLLDNSDCDVNEDLNLIKEDCDDFLDNLNDRLFGIEKIYSKMNETNINDFKMTINNFIEEVNNILNKINEKKEVM